MSLHIHNNNSFLNVNWFHQDRQRKKESEGAFKIKKNSHKRRGAEI